MRYSRHTPLIDLISIAVLFGIFLSSLYFGMRLTDWRARKQIHNFVQEKCLK